MDHTKDTWMRMRKEAEWGGGLSADTELAKVTATDWNELTIVVPFIFGGQTMPWIEFVREAIQVAGDDINKVHHFNKAMEKKEPGHKYYLQTSEFMEAAFSATAGNPGDSYMARWFKPEGEFESYGMSIKEWVLDYGGSDNFPSEAVKWEFYDVVDKTAAPLTPYAGETQVDGDSTVSTTFTSAALATFLTTTSPQDILEIHSGADKGQHIIASVETDLSLTLEVALTAIASALPFTIHPQIYRPGQPLTTKDITMTVDATPVTIKTMTCTVTNELEEETIAGSLVKGKGGIKNRPITLSISVSTEIGTLAKDTAVEDHEHHDIVITLGYSTPKIITLSNMIVTACNIENIPEFGMYEYTLELARGDNFSAALS